MHTKKPYVVTVGYGRHLFTKGNLERQRMLRCAAETGHIHMIVFTKRTDGLTVQRVNKRLTIHPTNSISKFLMVFDAYRIGATLVRKGVSIVTTQDPFEAGVVGYFLQKGYGIHLTVQEHGDVFSTHHWRHETVGNWVRFVVGKFILRRANTIRVVARRIKKTVQTVAPGVRITILPVALDIDFFLTSRSVSVHNKKKEDFEFLWVGRFVSQKNLPMLLRAFKAVHQANPQVRLHLVGDGPLRPQMKVLTEEMFPDNTGEVIRFTDWSEDVPGLMRAADAYVLSSNYEGWGRVLIEAMVCQLPTVTTNVGCVGEVFVHGQHGLVVPVNDESKLIEAMIRISVDEELSQAIRGNLSVLDLDVLPGTDLASYGKAWRQALE